MEAILSTAISFVISYVANCLPIPTKGFDKKLESCYHRALKKWNVPQEVKDNAKSDMSKHLIGLREIITHTSKGHHPKECELLHFWAEEILGDPDCNQFISANQHEIMQIEMQKGFLKVEDVLDALNLQKKELEKISQKVQLLSHRGVLGASIYWDMWAIGANGLKLEYDIVLSGRKKISDEVLKACNTPMHVCIEAKSQSDALAFIVATILKYSPKNAPRTLVIENADAYRDFLNEKTPLIIVTNVLENPNYAVNKGHTVIWCGTPADKLSYAGKLTLPTVDREGFHRSLKACGLDDNTISSLILETKRESALLRRALGINCEKEAWVLPDNNKYYIPAILLGSWDETRDGDKDIASKLAGMDYSTFDKGLQMLLNSDEPPLFKVGGVWQISSPKLLLSRIMGELGNDTIKHFKECIDWILEDDDPDIIAKREATDLQFWKDKHLYSKHLRSGLLQSITIMAVVMETQGIATNWIDCYIASKLKEFSLERFLSNKQEMKWIAECSPKAFLDYLDNDIKNGANILSKIFEVKHTTYSLTGTEIHFTELLFCLEELAWDSRYLPRVTSLLLEFCQYPNDSNYSNKPIESLYNIYRFLLPQTLVEFPQRLEILKSLSKYHPKEVSDLCLKLLNGIRQTVFMPTSHFRWRYSDQIKSPTHMHKIPSNDVVSMTELLLSIMELNVENLCKLIDLATNDFMHCSHSLLLAKLNCCESIMKGNETIIECLRKNINQHLRYRNAVWSIKAEELSHFQNLLVRIESDDVIIRNKHFFENPLIKDELEDIDKNFAKLRKESRVFRKKILEEIITTKGWDGICELSKCVGDTNSLAEAVVELTGNNEYQKIYKLYCIGKLNTNFVRGYFRTLYYEFGKDSYLFIINELKAASINQISIVLYAPEVNPEITAIVDTSPENIQIEYWNNICIWGLMADSTLYTIERLRSVGRYSDIIKLVHHNELKSQINSSLWLEILFEIFDKGQMNVLYQESYCIAKILKSITIPDEITAKMKLILLELMMFDHLRHYMDKSEIHLLHLVNTEPEIMMELVQLAYREDENYRENIELTELESNNRIALAQLAWNFFYHYHSVPGTKPNGTIDADYLKDYLTRLQQCAEACHRVHVMPLVIGRILGNMPEIEEYPSDLMCELVEYFDNDDIDTEISCCLSNRRGMSSRSPYDGGDIERSHIETFKMYRDRALTRSPRLVKVFENEIKSYEHMAMIEDERGKLTDLQY